MDIKNKSEAGGQENRGAKIIAAAIDNLAEAIREHTRALISEEEILEPVQYDLAGNLIE